MDWRAVETGLAAWVQAMTGVAPELIAWDREPVGFRKYPQVDLRLFDHRGRDGMTPEVIYPDPTDPTAPLQPQVVAQRACSWSITVTTRDQRANAKAYVMLDMLAVLIETPFAVETFGALGLAMSDVGRVITSTDIPSEHRDLSQATLTLELGYVLTASVPDTVPGATVEIIEHAEVGGTAIDVNVPIPIGPTMMPPLPVHGALRIQARPLLIGGRPVAISTAGATV